MDWLNPRDKVESSVNHQPVNHHLLNDQLTPVATIRIPNGHVWVTNPQVKVNVHSVHSTTSHDYIWNYLTCKTREMQLECHK